MAGMDDERHKVFGQSLARLVVAKLVLAFENVWRAGWPLAALAGFFLSLAWAGLFEYLNFWPHVVVLGLFALAALATLPPILRACHLPAATTAARRMERVSGLAHRPLATVDDRLELGGNDPYAQRLWAAHVAAATQAAGRVALPRPAPNLADRDPHAFRFGVVLLMVVTGIAAGPLLGQRTFRAFDIRSRGGSAAVATAPAYVAWITPPIYTGKPPISLGADGTKPGNRLVVPQGSTVIAQISHVGAGAIALNGKVIALTSVEADSVSGATTITGGSRLSLLDGKDEIAAWPLIVAPDAPPKALFITPPKATAHQALKIAYRAADDYGLTGIALRLTLAEPGADARAPLVIPLQSAMGQSSLKGTAFKDLTANAWAGLKVKAEIVATDTAGQTGTSPGLTLTLPERKFSNPVAREIIAERKRLIAHPDQRRPVIERLSEIANDTDRYDNRASLYLGFSVAIAYIAHHQGSAMVNEVATILWDMALDLEEGQVASAGNTLRHAQDALHDALQNGASEAKISRLMAALRKALNSYLNAMAADAARRGQPPTSASMTGDGRVITSDQLRAMLDQLQRMVQGGSREQAARMLSGLRQTLENLRAMQAVRPGSSAAAMGKGLDDLQRMITRQRDLRDQSFSAAERQSQSPETSSDRQDFRDQFGTGAGQSRPKSPRQTDQGQPGQKHAGQGNTLSHQALAQEDLRRHLSALMGKLNKAGVDPSAHLGQADQAMKAARQALESSNPNDAAVSQGQALQALHKGIQSLGKSLARQLGVEQGHSLPSEGQVDPLGRPRPGREFGTGDNTKVPTTFEVKRVRTILDELRRRIGEHGRPQDEHNYIERLLKPY